MNYFNELSITEQFAVSGGADVAMVASGVLTFALGAIAFFAPIPEPTSKYIGLGGMYMGANQIIAGFTN